MPSKAVINHLKTIFQKMFFPFAWHRAPCLPLPTESQRSMGRFACMPCFIKGVRSLRCKKLQFGPTLPRGMKRMTCRNELQSTSSPAICSTPEDSHHVERTESIGELAHHHKAPSHARQRSKMTSLPIKFDETLRVKAGSLK